MVKSKNQGKGKNSDDPDLEKEFEDEINKPYYKVDYLDDFKLPYDSLDVSAILPTYNRAPYKPGTLRGDYNPLTWAIKSLLLQKPAINEIVIVDDDSEDYTKDVVDSFKKEAKEKNVELKYIKNRRHMGYSKSINNGVSVVNSKYILFVDDDGVIAPYTAFGGVFTFEWIRENGINIGILNLPPYLRSSLPENIKPKNKISQIDFSKGLYLSNKASFPEEYLSKEINGDKFIHAEFHILKPIPIQNSGGYFMCPKKVFVELGGFPTTLAERFPEREFGCMALDNGYSIYLSVDPKFQCVHGSYGLKTGREFIGDDWFMRVGGEVSLKKAMHECDKFLENTGCRVDQKEFIYHSMVAIFNILYPRNSRGAIKWIDKVYEEFVINGDLSILNTSLKEPMSQKERKELWDNALKKSLYFIKKRELLKLKRINNFKKRVEKEEITLDTLNMLK